MKKTNKVAKVNFFKGGSGGLCSKISLPSSWLKILKITEDERDIVVFLDEKKERIIVEKKK